MNEEARRGMDILTAPPQRSRDLHMCRGHARLSVRADSRLAFGSLDDVRHEERPRHRANTAGVGAEPAGHLIDAIRDVTHQSSLAILALHAAHADVEDDGAGGPPCRG